MKNILCVAIASLFAANVAAHEGLYIVGGGVSKHYKDDDQNEVHPSIGIEYDGFSVIYVEKNSIDQKSVQVAYSDNWYESNYVDFGYRVGLASGYKKGTLYDDGNRYYNGFEFGSTGLIPIIAAEVTIHTPVPNFHVVMDVSTNVTMFGFKYKI